MGIWNSFAGELHVEVTSADIAGFLSAAGVRGICFKNVMHTGPLTVSGSILRRDYKGCRKLIQQRGESLRILKQQGAFWRFKALVHRPLLMAGMLLFFIAVLYIPSRVYFIKVEGNISIPEKKILEQAASCGISFGASRRAVRSEKMKNALLEQMPQLQWAGINTSGCVATIQVREKTVTENDKKQAHSVSSIIASRDGIVQEYTVIQGNPLCQKGQAVKAGEVLISGYTDCGISIRATQAKGEVFAKTYRQIDVITPVITANRGRIMNETSRYSLLLGKKLIKFYKDSGILDTSCVKMCTVDYLTLPGGFPLPIALVSERFATFEMGEMAAQEINSFSWLADYAGTYTKGQMVAGQILQSNLDLQTNEDVIRLHGDYVCLEMIGQTKNEEILGTDGKDN